MRWAMMVAAVLAGTSAVAGPVETIRYETTACFGFCPAYAVTVSTDGRGLIDGHGHTAVVGPRRFRVTPAQFAAFRAALQPVRPTGEVLIVPGTPRCGTAATDQISVDVRWTGGRRDPRHLAVYFGCGMDRHHDLRRVLGAAPAALPIAAFIGRR